MNYQEVMHKIEPIQQYLWRQALYYTNDNTKAKDLVQDTIYKVLTKIHLYKKDTNFKAWTSTILRNTFISQYRRKKKYKVTELETSYEALTSNSVFNTAEYHLMKEEIDEMLSKLSPLEKQVIEMRQKGYAYREITEQLRVPIGTVKSRIHSARKELKKEFQTKMRIAV